MKILAYTSLKGKKGGAQTSYDRITSGLMERGHTVIKAYCDYNLNDGEIIEVNGNIFIKLYSPSRLLFLRDIKVLYETIKSTYRLYKLLKYHNPDLVYFHFFKKEQLIFSIVKLFMNFKLITGLQGGDIPLIDQHARDILEKSLGNTNSIIT